MAKVYRYLLLCFALLAVCGGAGAKQKFSYDGVRFSYPEEWRIAEDERGELVSIRLEMEGDNDGTVGFVWANVDFSVVMSVDEFFDSILRDVVGNEEDDLRIETIADARFGKYPAEGRRLSEGVGEQRLSGDMYIIMHDDRWLFVLTMCADGDRNKHTEGFEMIEKSLRIGKTKTK